jgi:FkbM family methyltransferase
MTMSQHLQSTTRFRALVKKVIIVIVSALSRRNIGRQVLDHFILATRNLESEILYGDNKYKFSTPNHLSSERAKTFSTKEPETLEWIDRFDEGAVVWDIGANVGLYSIYAAMTRSSVVFAFEPSVLNLEWLARNISANGLEQKISLIPIALSDTSQMGTLTMSQEDWGGSMSSFGVDYTHDGSVIQSLMSYQVLGLSGDDVVRCLSILPPDYIKIDVDGTEHLVLAGMTNLLSTVKSILVEVNDVFELQRNNVNNILSEAGFQMHEKRRSAMFDGTDIATSYNQIWVK